jgi:exodeoxyribonuclease VII large subunit
VRGRVGLYEGRGEYQLVIEHMEEAGFGALQRQFETLKLQLASEGLFDNQHKKPMPKSVGHIGVVTSSTGAAVKDILAVLNRRFPSIQVSIFPTAVQGEKASGQIVNAIADANRHGQCDVLIVGRGGGSLEDLWSFNEEAVARAIFASEIPVLSAVGHEVDFTIADFVADVRAPTPSAAAELVSPDGQDMLNQFRGFAILLRDAMARTTQKLSLRVNYLHKRLQHPGRKLQEQAQHLDHLDIRLRRAIDNELQRQQSGMATIKDKLLGQNPGATITLRQHQVRGSIKQLSRSAKLVLETKQTKALQAMHLLDTVSPLKTLGRGYSIIRDSNNAVIKTVSGIRTGDSLKGQLADGEVLFAVTQTTTKTL